MIEATGLTKHYGQTVAIESLDLSVPDGVVYGFLGPNGAGKTTTMRILTTLTQPTSGSATINGTPISDRTAVTRHIGYLPEVPPLYAELTAFEQLDLAAGLRDLSPSQSSERITSLLDRLDLREDAQTKIADFSRGMRQKTGFIQAILHDPAVLFLDEPTAGLDPRAARTLRELIVEHAASGTTVFLSTHILSVVEEIADTVGVLYDGRLVAEDTPSDLTHRAETGDHQTLEAAFLELTSEEPNTEQAAND
ncbi:ABC transporter ATP-binding protein [Halostagnicola kamekurae]|uniref:ABC-2 type transport system ATP-binding protein n=1 Tax=Halostagnicola kamekurae TaxID=619731 RepID=A0A1I6RW38_9EURY|nr:ABC transporter ATP-binding protein [Halostagnicola kamekurae]SFS68896.1 ABC-2 type transport system ATP-binding protein [Halostagnicola kamekurae]